VSYRLILKRSAEKELLALPKAQAFKVKSAIEDLS
jgi:mRNA-degrading endonuclease RelE of RelBE toxin-antitoxin system